MDLQERFWHDRTVFVTGASGIVGSWLVRALLEKQARVVALIRDFDPRSQLFRSGDIQRITVVSGRLEDFSTLERAISEHEPDSVFHLGAQALVTVAHRSPLATFESNIRGTYNLLEACRRHSQLVDRVVVASSDKAYGESRDLPYEEEMPLRGRHPYNLSKSCTDLLAQGYFHTYQLPVAIARCGNVFGGGDLNWSRLVPGTIRSLFSSQRPVVRSDGNFIRDYIYVKDAVEAYLSLACQLERQQVRGEAFNFSYEVQLSVLEMVEKLQRLTGREDLSPQIVDTAQGEIRDQYLSAAKARKVLMWRPAYDLDEGLRETLEWYESYLESDRSAPRPQEKVR